MSRPKKKIIENRIYELAPDKPYFCLSGDEWLISDVLSDRLHFHNHLEIGYCFSDHGFLSFEGDKTIPFQAGDIFLIPRFIPHTTCSARGCRSHWNYLYLDLDMVSRGQLLHISDQGGRISSLIGSYLRLTTEEYPRLHFLCKCLLEEAIRDQQEDLPLFTLYSHLLTEELRRTLHAETRSEVPSHGVFSLKHALEYIDDHYMEPCSTEKLASLCHLSETHFRRLFLSSMHTTPLKYVLQVRIRQACILLKTTKKPVTTIGQMVGINSISSFNRNFQQVMGVSPQQYRSTSNQEILSLKGWLLPED
ncbi:MAG: helix-turn-helix domain-containing protein [Clostridia bacterium]|nr:helix-turn-helix domain-containing protein [Clostridia bacterium]